MGVNFYLSREGGVRSGGRAGGEGVEGGGVAQKERKVQIKTLSSEFPNSVHLESVAGE